MSLFRWTGLHEPLARSALRRHRAPSGKREAWFQDQYCHPHETCHTLDEVLGWMDEDGFEFVNSIPKPVAGPGAAASASSCSSRAIAGTAAEPRR